LGALRNVAEFINSVLETDLRKNEFRQVWYLVQQIDPNIVFTRSAYYFIGMYILGSIVRYDPEMLLDITDPYSEIAWILSRFIEMAERYFPQLILIEFNNNRPIYF